MRVSLRFTIPAIILISAMAILLVALVMIKPILENNNLEELRTEARHTVNRLQGTLEYLLQKGDLEGVRREILLSASSSKVKNLILFDHSDFVMVSANPEHDNASFFEVQPYLHLSLDLLVRARNAGGYVFEANDVEKSLYAAIPVQQYIREATELRPDTLGVILLELDERSTYLSSWNELKYLFYTLLTAFILLAVVLAWALNAMVTRRAKRLVRQSTVYSEGQFQHRETWRGWDELGILGRSLNQMAGQIQQYHTELKTNAILLEQLLNNSPSMIMLRDGEGRFIRANPSYLRFYGIKNIDALRELSLQDLFQGEELRDLQQQDQKVLESGEPMHGHFVVEKQGKRFQFLCSRFALENEQGQRYAVCSIDTDISERQAKEDELRLSRYIFDTTNEGIMVTDNNHVITDVNAAFERVTGYSLEEVRGSKPSILNSGKHKPAFYEDMWHQIDTLGSWAGEIWNRKKNGDTYPEWLTIKSIVGGDGQISGYFGVFTDISEHKKTQESLKSLAYYDPLTELANRTLCQERLVHDMRLADRHAESLALVFIDLDFFKHINDSLGHEYGDQLLTETARRIESQVRQSDTVVRWGGDEFILILPGIHEINMAQIIADKVRAQLKLPYYLKNTETFIGASIGIAIYPHDGVDATTLIQHADAAMYSAKKKGRDQICFFDKAMNEKNLEQIKLKGELRQALEQDQLEIYYQPKVAISTGDIIGMEALLRWRGEDGQFISPAEFIPVAESSGLILPIGEWVFSTVAEQVHRWKEAGLMQSRRVSVNLSPKQLVDPNLVVRLRDTLESYTGLDNTLSIEITETAVIENLAVALPVLQQIRGIGIELELDDFGSGYSSLNYLRRLPVDVLKVDKSFTFELDQKDTDIAIMQAIINMAHTLGMTVVAEGVESKNQFASLARLGCDIAQGYLFAPALAAPEMEKLLLGQGFDVAQN
ncbi:bifunctional diguanylate cyclase/phosphodiesterase [Neptuniibacter sp. CAU 1671]|uniref:bifunctional diguanylate cyclase/phosphodiesterase n=1 Tax=Neptuniibacter sp. CAU 1671 TaxID=3032593 RepID=UPI0023DCCDDE|nr:bifunctional diguanylate cyclase/phosphodiesterase [Neptuniibacter sp. CAU 1671]MDF2182051.1 EAL domain-containing protein [Neptuniibacter sp. CAU 1671]